MSELQESQRPISAGAKSGAGPAPKPNPSVNTANPAASNAGQGVTGVNNAAAGAAQSATPVQPQQPYTPVFTTDKIQHTKATKPREYFDEQNRKTAERKKQDNKNRKTIIIIGAAIIGVLALIAIIWWVVIKVSEPKGPTGQVIPTITSDSNEEVNKVQEYLQNVYNDYNAEDSNDTNNNSAKLDAANEAAEEILASGSNSQYASQIILAQIKFYFSNGYYDEIIANADKVNVDDLAPEQKLSYYNCLALTYQNQGNQEKSDEYFNLLFAISTEVNGSEEYGDE